MKQTIRKQSLRKAQEDAFLKSYNGKDICLRFPIDDIEPARSGNRDRKVWNEEWSGCSGDLPVVARA